MKKLSLVMFILFAFNVLVSCDKICIEDGDIVLCETRKKVTSDTLVKGKKLLLKEYLMSENGLYRFKLYKKGDLVISDTVTHERLWEAFTHDSGATNLKILGNGNLRLRGRGKTVWKTSTAGSGADSLKINNDGSLVLYAGDVEVWSVNKDPDPPSTGPRVDFVGIDNYNNLDDPGSIITIENMPAGTQMGDAVGMVIMSEISEISELPTVIEPIGDWELGKNIEENGIRIEVYYKIIAPSPVSLLDRDSFTLTRSQTMMVVLSTFRGIAE